MALASHSAGVEIGLRRVDADDPRTAVGELHAARAEELGIVLVAHIAGIVVTQQHDTPVAGYPVEEVARLLELVAEPHVGQIAGHDDDVGAQQVQLIDDTLGERRDVVARSAVQIGDVSDDRRLTHGPPSSSGCRALSRKRPAHRGLARLDERAQTVETSHDAQQRPEELVELVILDLDDVVVAVDPAALGR